MLIRKRDEGAIAVLTALLMLVLMGAGALAVDLGNAWARKRAIQNSADLAALAGAQGLPSTSAARTSAKDYITRNVIQGQGLSGIAVNWDDDEGVPATDAAFAAVGRANGEIDFFLDANGDGSPQRAEMVGSGQADLIRVVPPPATVQFGLAKAIGGGASTTVRLPASARIGTALGLGTPPFFLTTADSGSTCIQDAPPGGGGPGGFGSALPSALRLNPPTNITIANITPEPASVGSTISISGSFPTNTTAGAITVSFAGTGQNNASVQAQIVGTTSATNINVRVPSLAADSYKVTVSGGGWSNATRNNFQVTAAPASIVLNTVSPSTAATGATVTLVGTGFPTTSAVVKFGTATASVTTPSATSTQITVLAPAGTGTVPVPVGNGASTSNSVNFTYATAAPAPITLTSVAPGSATAGAAVTLNGTGFPTTGAVVSFGTATATVTAATATQLTVTVPAGPSGVVQVSVSNGATTSNTVSFTYTGTTAWDPCTAASSNRGALDEPRYSPNSQFLENNIKSGLDHNLHVWQLWPVAGSPRTLPGGNPDCGDVNSAYPGSVFKSGASSPIPDINCAHLRTGSFSGPLEQGFFDNSASSPGRLRATSCAPSLRETRYGHSDVDMTNMFTTDFIDTSVSGRSVADFKTKVTSGAAAAPADRGYLKAEILGCPRFAILPVIDPALPVPNGGQYYPILGFKAVYFDSDTTSCPTADRGFIFQGSSLKGVCGYIIDAGYLPATVSSQFAGVIGPYTGPGLPAVPLLTRDPTDRPS